jgi:hypothetical protein
MSFKAKILLLLRACLYKTPNFANSLIRAWSMEWPCLNMFSDLRKGCHIKKRVQYGNLEVRACTNIYFGHALRCGNIFLGMSL